MKNYRMMTEKEMAAEIADGPFSATAVEVRNVLAFFKHPTAEMFDNLTTWEMAFADELERVSRMAVEG